jgi:putative ABC transport system permease protein
LGYSGAAEIRGISGDARESGLDHPPVPTAYWCAPLAEPGTYFLVRTRNIPMTMAETIRRQLRDVEPMRSAYDFAPLEQHYSDALAENLLHTVLLTFFAATALSLACIGLYGTLSYNVNLRQREVGLRLALGALRGQIVKRFLWQGLSVCLAGCLAGFALTVASTRLLAGLLYGVSPTDFPTCGRPPARPHRRLRRLTPPLSARVPRRTHASPPRRIKSHPLLLLCQTDVNRKAGPDVRL